MPPANALLQHHGGDEGGEKDGLQFERECDAEEKHGEGPAAGNHTEGAEKKEAGVDDVGLPPDGAVYQDCGAGENAEGGDELRDGSPTGGCGASGEAAYQVIGDDGGDNIEDEGQELDLRYPVDMAIEVRGHHGEIEIGREIHAERVLQGMPSAVLQQVGLPGQKGVLKIGVDEVSPESDAKREQRQRENDESHGDRASWCIFRGRWMRRVMSGRTHASDDTGLSRAGRP